VVPKKDEEKTDKARTIGNYVIGKTLGEGTFGKVRIGTHVHTNEKVTIFLKTLRLPLKC
jgi:serine/threonine protein kinase